MKKLFPAACGLMLLMTSCDKTAIKQTTETIKNADSLYQNVSKGYKTVDSISKAWRKDRDNLPPEIREKTEVIKKNIDLKNISIKNIDSVAAAIKDLSKNVQGDADVARTIDSAANAIKNSNDPLATIGAVSGAIDKISRKNTVRTRRIRQDSVEQNTDDQIPDDPAFTSQPLSKNAEVTVIVDDMHASIARLKQLLNSYHADILSEEETDSEGTSRENFTVKIPLKYFDQGLGAITQNLGTTTEKSIATDGTDYHPNQMCDIRITLRENPNLAGKDIGNDAANTAKNTQETEQNSSEFSKSLKGMGAVLWSLLPYSPLLIIGLFIWYLAERRKRKAREREFQKQQEYNQEMHRKIAEHMRTEKEQDSSPKPSAAAAAERPTDPDDYSRFMPK